VVESGALLKRCRGLNPYRGFESLSLRHFVFATALRFAVVGLCGPCDCVRLGRAWAPRRSGAMPCRPASRGSAWCSRCRSALSDARWPIRGTSSVAMTWLHGMRSTHRRDDDSSSHGATRCVCCCASSAIPRIPRPDELHDLNAMLPALAAATRALSGSVRNREPLRLRIAYAGGALSLGQSIVTVASAPQGCSIVENRGLDLHVYGRRRA
jgi:hypothetical protein